MLLSVVVWTTSQQERTQEATRLLDEFAAAEHVVRQRESHCGSRNWGRVAAVSCSVLLLTMSTESELKLDGIVPVRLFEDTSIADSIGKVPMTCRRAPVTELLDSVRDVREGK